jgi:hypothetical protein
MGSKIIKNLAIESLSDVSDIDPEAVGFYKHNCMICFDQNRHYSGIEMDVYHNQTCDIFTINWQGEVTEKLRKMHRDQNKLVDFGACAIALLLVPEITKFKVTEQSAIGTTIDYYLTPQIEDDTLIFNHAARLEVSGILKENEKNTIDKRVKDKIKRLKPHPAGELPTFIIVVEFSKPCTKMIEYGNCA